MNLFKWSKKTNNYKNILLFAFVATLFVFKLDYAYFFTDEILYIDDGREHLNGIYASSMQVPLITKYIAAVMYHVADHNTFLLRLPFAFMGILTSLVIYLIVRREYDSWWGGVAVLLFATSEIILSSTKMIMLEPLLHLAWVLFLYFHYETLKKYSLKNYILAGLFFGLSFGAKATSIILIPFVLVFIPYLYKQKRPTKEIITGHLALFATGGALFLTTYIDAFIKTGERNTINRVISALNDVYVTKSAEGKPHIVDNVVYLRSPWWTYFYYLGKNGLLRTLVYFTGVFGAIKSRGLFVYYWGTFFLFSFIFHQFSGVKNLRYVSSFEIPLIILCVSGLAHLVNKKKITRNLVIVAIALIAFVQVVSLIQMQKTEYKGLFEEYLAIETNDFTSDDKIYVYGSTRSSRWYKHGKAEGKNMFEISKNLEAYCPGFYEYTLIILDKEELQRYGPNLLTNFVETNKNSFEKIDKHGFYIYKKVGNEIVSVCDVN